jgi:hypothetical protein
MGSRCTADYYGGNFAPAIDRLLGDAFYSVKNVADNIDSVKYLNYNMAQIQVLAANVAVLQAVANSVGELTGLPAIFSGSNTSALLTLLNLAAPLLPLAEGAPGGVGTPHVWLNGGTFCYG